MTFGIDGFGGAAVRPVRVELFTAAYRLGGTIQTRFNRVAEILNQLSSTHLRLEAAEVHELATGSSRWASLAMVSLDEILVLAAPELTGASSAEMRIQKRPVRAELAIPPLRVEGTVHVAIGGQAVDGLLNVQDRYVALTDMTATAVGAEEVVLRADAAAVRRDRAHLLLVADEDRMGEPLATELDEERAAAWLRGSLHPAKEPRTTDEG